MAESSNQWFDAAGTREFHGEMPELPEVQTVVTTLAPLVVGQQVRGVLHLRADMVRPADFDLSAAITGQRILSLTRRAKRIVFTLADRSRFYIHLGMTGQLTVESARAGAKTHTHLQIDLGDGKQLRLVDPRRFGAIVWIGDDPRDDELGPEPLTLAPRRLARILRGTRRPIKVALLAQEIIAGIGNIYADEALHRAQIHPLQIAKDLSDSRIATLNRAIKHVLRTAIRAGGSSIRDYVDANGARGAFQERHRVYDRTGKPCVVCRSVIERIVVGGRSTHFCPKCQKLSM